MPQGNLICQPHLAPLIFNSGLVFSQECSSHYTSEYVYREHPLTANLQIKTFNIFRWKNDARGIT
jgi:hypothetical protein